MFKFLRYNKQSPKFCHFCKQNYWIIKQILLNEASTITSDNFFSKSYKLTYIIILNCPTFGSKKMEALLISSASQKNLFYVFLQSAEHWIINEPPEEYGRLGKHYQSKGIIRFRVTFVMHGFPLSFRNNLFFC